MSDPTINTWLDVQTEVMRRLHKRVWKPGELLPGEIELAAEFGCARTTVNRALQAIAEDGLLERKRRGGTRVVVHPERKATFTIPVIRLQIEQSGYSYSYRLLSRRNERPPANIRTSMDVGRDSRLLHLRALHCADQRPYVLEDRWINTSVVPAVADADFKLQSPNEWLVEHVPFSGGDFALSACVAGTADADTLDCDAGAALFTVERRTHNARLAVITSVQLKYVPGYSMRIAL